MQHTHAVIVITRTTVRNRGKRGATSCLYTAHCPALGLTGTGAETPQDAVRRLTESITADAVTVLQDCVPDELVVALPVQLTAADEEGGPAIEWGDVDEADFTCVRALGNNEPTIGAVLQLLKGAERDAFLAEVHRATLGDQLTQVLTRWWVHALLGRYKVPVATIANMRLIELPPQRDPSPEASACQTH
ncbi:hypothetical protein ABZ135_23460 [Streptomyces sp. NPDC006339]|uniref:hypothetical protein n=1 Tax=Streptomyces sp. NPDC006339 TaxID=3156755 RepID=UPI0033AD7B0C